LSSRFSNSFTRSSFSSIWRKLSFDYLVFICFISNFQSQDRSIKHMGIFHFFSPSVSVLIGLAPVIPFPFSNITQAFYTTDFSISRKRLFHVTLVMITKMMILVVFKIWFFLCERPSFHSALKKTEKKVTDLLSCKMELSFDWCFTAMDEEFQNQMDEGKSSLLEALFLPFLIEYPKKKTFLTSPFYLYLISFFVTRLTASSSYISLEKQCQLFIELKDKATSCTVNGWVKYKMNEWMNAWLMFLWRGFMLYRTIVSWITLAYNL